MSVRFIPGSTRKRTVPVGKREPSCCEHSCTRSRAKGKFCNGHTQVKNRHHVKKNVGVTAEWRPWGYREEWE